jgi:hypothetical protein
VSATVENWFWLKSRDGNDGYFGWARQLADAAAAACSPHPAQPPH